MTLQFEQLEEVNKYTTPGLLSDALREFLGEFSSATCFCLKFFLNQAENWQTSLAQQKQMFDSMWFLLTIFDFSTLCVGFQPHAWSNAILRIVWGYVQN